MLMFVVACGKKEAPTEDANAQQQGATTGVWAHIGGGQYSYDAQGIDTDTTYTRIQGGYDAKTGSGWTVGGQVSAALKGLSNEQVSSLVIAYEPIWAIGTGKSASQDDAQKMCKVVRDVVAADFGQEVADKVRVQYGGSVKPENIAEYMACPDVDGALVGGASLQPDSFLALLEAVK